MSDTSTGIPVALEAFLAEFFGLLGGLIVFLIEKSNIYCKAHGANAIIWGIIYIVLWIIIFILGIIAGIIGGIVGVIFWVFTVIVAILFFAIWVFHWVVAIMKAESQEFLAFPLVSSLAQKWAGN